MTPAPFVRVMVAALALASFGAVTSASCSSSAPAIAPPDVGLKVAGDAWAPGPCQPGHTLAWSADGSEIYYIAFVSNSTAAAPYEIHAAKADGSGARNVDLRPGVGTVSNLAAPPDGSSLYYAGGTDLSISEIFGQSLLSGTSTAVVMAASSDDHHVAYAYRDLSLYDTEVGTSVAASAPGDHQWSALAFSPSGDQLFAVDTALGVGITVDLMGRQLSTVSLAQWGARNGGATWGPDGVLYLAPVPHDPSHIDFAIDNVTASSSITLATPTSQGNPGCAAWSARGNLVALWIDVCTDGAKICSIQANDIRRDLYVADTTSGVAQRIAGGVDFMGSELAFSPDGTRVAYLSGADLFVSDIP